MNLFKSKNSNSTNHKFNQRALLLIPLVLASFALLPTAWAVLPAPEGGYPGANTAEGTDALLGNTTGVGNTALGFEALLSNAAGNFNTATGVGALFTNSADRNTATGAGALFTNNGGSRNTADGVLALVNNTGGSDNTAVGDSALFSNTEGHENTALGQGALSSNTTADYNTAVGYEALFGNTGGFDNTAVGEDALTDTTTGGDNTAVGFDALEDNIGGSFNIALGSDAGINLTTGSNNIDIGNSGVAGEGNSIRIGTQGTQTASYIAGISGESAVGGDAVYVTSTGKLGTITAVSSQRFKDDIKAMGKDSAAILALRPVTFRYKKEINSSGIRQFGLVAEEVAKVAPELVKCDPDGKPYTVRYDAVNVMLLNEFLKEHRRAEEQARKVQNLEGTVASLVATVKEQAALIQKVSAKVELQKPSAQTVVNNQ
jgi:hypothetical protein